MCQKAQLMGNLNQPLESNAVVLLLNKNYMSLIEESRLFI